MKRIIFSFFLFFILNNCFGQNGKILDQTPVTLQPSSIEIIKSYFPHLVDSVTHVNYYKIAYLSDGLKVKGFIASPKKEGNYPCIIYNRGGNQDFGKIEDWQLGAFLGIVASWGYIVVGSQYRGNDGGEGKEEFGGKDVNDVINLIPLFNHIPGADTSRMGIYGVSRGGMMTYKALTKTNKFKAAISLSGSADELQGMKDRPEFDSLYIDLVPGYSKNKTAALKERSAFYFADKMDKTTPILILQGTGDWRVPTNEVLPLVNKLYQLKHPMRFVLFEGGSHALVEYSDEVWRQIQLFFDTYVKYGRKWPSLDNHGE